MKSFLNLFLSLYGQTCTSIVFNFEDGTSSTIEGNPICSDIINITRDQMAAKLKRTVNPEKLNKGKK